MLEAIDPVVMNGRALAFRCASLHADRAFQTIISQMKADVLRRWANEQEKDKREVLWLEIQVIQQLADKVKELADEKRIIQRKEDLAAARARRVDNNASQW